MKKFIIPAAGFGKRVGLSKAKELLFYRKEVKPILLWSLELAKAHGFVPVVISRKDKTDLNKFLEDIQLEYKIEICLINSSEEWTDSVFQSQDFWGERNILVLPDSRFAPVDVVSKIEFNLIQNDLCFATFDVLDFKTWGVITKNKDFYGVVEKPVENLNCEAQAWGLIGFQKSAGVDLFEALKRTSRNHQIEILKSKKVTMLNLDFYEDITRSPDNLSV